MKINVVTLCSGYDSQCLALERLKRNFADFDYELVAWAEYDPESKQPLDKQPAIIAHNALFPQWADRNIGDITTADWSKITEPIDLLCYSTPCQSISNAGLQEGFKEGSGTKSSVIWSVLNAIKVLKPKYLLMENVPAMVSSKFIKDFHEWQNAVSSFGYEHFTQILNAKDYGVPQNRERVFMISILNGGWGRYYFPKPFKLKKRLKDVLELIVDEKYYLSDKIIQCFENRTKIAKEKGNGFRFNPTDREGYAKAITTCAGNRPVDNFIKEMRLFKKDMDNIALTKNTAKTICLNSKVNGKQPSVEYRIYNCDGIFTTITTGFLPSIAEPKIIQIGNIINDIDRNFKNPQSGRVYSTQGLAPTITTCQGGGLEPKIIRKQEQKYRIRKLTPRECFRLMDMEYIDIDKIQATGISNSQQYKLAGNSIVVACLYHLFRKLFIKKEQEQNQLKLF